MSTKTNEIVNKFMTQEFSQEITDADAMLFIASHPDKLWAKTILFGYLLSRSIVDTPYQALKIAIASYLDTLEEENGN